MTGRERGAGKTRTLAGSETKVHLWHHQSQSLDLLTEPTYHSIYIFEATNNDLPFATTLCDGKETRGDADVLEDLCCGVLRWPYHHLDVDA